MSPLVRRKGQRRIGRRAKLLIGVAAALSVGLTGALAFAYFTTTGRGTGAAATGSLGSPGVVTGSPSGSTVAVSWTAVTRPGSGTVGYYVTRTPYPSGSATAVCGSSPTSLLAGTSCNDTSVPPGNYTYTVTVVYDSWTNSASSAEVTVANPPVASAPGVSATVTYGTNPTWTDGQNVMLTDSPSANGGSAVSSVAYFFCPTSDSSCTSSDWTSIGSSSVGSSWSVSWSSLPADGTYDVLAVATNSAAVSSTSSAETEVGIDTTPPTVSTPSVNGYQ